MCWECSHCAAAFGMLGVLLLGPPAAGAQSAVPRDRMRTTTVAAPGKTENPPKAIDVLNAVRARLSAAQTVSFVAVVTNERLHRRSEVTLQRPDKLRVSVSGDGPRSESYCNGNTMVTYTPDERALKIEKAPPTLNECLKAAYQASAVDFPLIDLIVGPYTDLIPGVTHASYVGQSQLVGETTTDIVAYSRENVSVRIWVGTRDKLPRRLEAAYLDDPNWLRRSVAFSDWKIDVPVRPEVFTSLNGDRSDHISASDPHPVGTSGVEPAPTVRPLTLHTFSAKYWGSGTATVQAMPYGAGRYYQSPDGYTYYTPLNYGYYPPAIGCYGAQCYDSGNDYWATEGIGDDASAGFNIALSTSGWDKAAVAAGYNQMVPANRTNATPVPGQIVTTLPVGCAAYTRGAAFYLCGSTWFSGVYGPNGQLYFRVISVP